jgi:catechol 2,3-dioxygenase-like lactoylglutathione lyase family enzyme
VGQDDAGSRLGAGGRGVLPAGRDAAGGIPVPVEQIEPSPAFLHAGFRVATPDEVRALLARMEADGVTIVERDEEPAYAAFKCLDPDGHRIEVYWEPPPYAMT